MGRTDQKVLDDRYQVAPRTLCFITHGDDVLLLRGAPDKRIWPNRYNGVGGHVEPGEDVYNAALREIREETGLELVHDLRLRGVINIPVDTRGNTGIVVFVFTATAGTRDVRPSKEGTLEWVDRGRLAELDLVEDLPILLPRVLAMGADEPPFFAHYRYDEQDRLIVTISQSRRSLDRDDLSTGLPDSMKRAATWIGRLYLWASDRLYNELAWAYDPVSRLVSLGYWTRWRKPALDHVVGPRVLDVGFGSGELLIEMALRGLRAYGLDLSPAMHRVTARKMRRRGIQAPCVRALAQRMPFAGGSFDSITATFPTDYIADPRTLREVARLLRRPDPGTGARGGRFVVTGLVPDVNNAFLRWITRSIFGVPAEHILARYERNAAAAGLRVTVTTRDGKGLKTPVLIAEHEAHE